MSRKLASVVRVDALDPIPGADQIEVASVLGWKCVVKKDTFRVGDLGVYMEIDSVPPDEERYAFLWSKTERLPRPRNYRIRTVRLRGQVSQGLLLPISDVVDENSGPVALEVGKDLTDVLGVAKWEPPSVDVGGSQARGGFPIGVPKTDEVRIQAQPELLQALAGCPWEATVKLDGTSATFAMVDGEFHACSRNLSVREGDNIYWRMARRYRLPELLALAPNLAIQGEICGPAIQKNRLGLGEHDLFVFDMWDYGRWEYLSSSAVRELCHLFGLRVVPLAAVGTAFNLGIEDLLRAADGKYEGTDNDREGIVVRSSLEGCVRPDLRVSFKVVSNRFLLGGGE